MASCWLPVASVVIVGLAALFSGLLSRDRFDGCCPVLNWEQRHAFDSPVVLRPSSLAEVVAAVNMARLQRKRLTIVGSGHSYSSIAVPNPDVGGTADDMEMHNNGSVLVCMRCYSGLVRVDSDSHLVTVLAGTSLEQLISILDQHRLALDVMPTVFEPTIGGIVAAGSHGCGTKHSSVASLVREIELVTPDGEVVTASPEKNPDIFYGATVGLGSLGVLTKVTLQTGPAYNLAERSSVMHLTELAGNFEHIVTESEYVKILVEYHTGAVQIISSNRTHEQPRNSPTRLEADFWAYVIEAFQFSTMLYPAIIPATMRFLIHHLRVFSPSERVETWSKALSIQQYIPLHLESEFAVPLAQTPQAIEAVYKLVDEIGIGISVFNEVSFAPPITVNWLKYRENVLSNQSIPP
eukprot:scpid82318/ scgid5537/ L-gulonolactone oxidase; L-gulono-gamma-lactone oxidase